MLLETKRLQVKKTSKFTHPYHSIHYGEVQPFLPWDISTHVPCIIITLFPVLVLVHGLKTNLFVATSGVTSSPLTCSILPLKQSALFCWKIQGSLPALLPHPLPLLCSLLGKMNIYPANTHLVQLASGEHHFLGYSSKMKQTQNEFTDYTIHL